MSAKMLLHFSTFAICRFGISIFVHAETNVVTKFFKLNPASYSLDHARKQPLNTEKHNIAHLWILSLVLANESSRHATHVGVGEADFPKAKCSNTPKFPSASFAIFRMTPLDRNLPARYHLSGCSNFQR